MKLSADQIKKVAKLANITITTEEEENYSTSLSKVLDYIDSLNLVNTLETNPIFNVAETANESRPDSVSGSLSQADSLQNAKAVKNALFATKGVFQE